MPHNFDSPHPSPHDRTPRHPTCYLRMTCACPLVAARRSYNPIDEDAREEARGALAFVEELYV